MRITSENLDITVELNRKIESEVQSRIRYMQKFLSKNIYSPEKQALHILKNHNLIQVPIPDLDWGGAIYELPNGNKVPIINTAQPRLYQYFICWHEVYHLTEDDSGSSTHHINTEPNLTERKADYFASQMLISDDVYDIYHHLRYKEFLDRVAYCMDTFKAPYKAILIQLYEMAIRLNNPPLQKEIKVHFDLKIDEIQWEQRFQNLSLDDSLVKPTYVIDFGPLKELMHEKSQQFEDVELYQENFKFIESLDRRFKELRKDRVGEF